MLAFSQPLKASGIIFNVQRFCIEDGPGIRTTVFFKGCPLRCPWCHNPEGISAAPQIVLSKTRCMNCGSCIEACSTCAGDHTLENCARCGLCAEVCPTGAREMVGRTWTVDEVRSMVLRDRIFYDSAEGGVTFSGGEPLCQPDFLIACLQACRSEGVHTTLDTCGFGARDKLLHAAELTDLVLFDLKILDSDGHLRHLGAPLEPILENLDALIGQQQRIWLRLPVIPGLTDTDQNLASVLELASGASCIEKICLLPYHETGVSKHLNINKNYDLNLVSPPSDQRMREIAAQLSDAASEVVIGG